MKPMLATPTTASSGRKAIDFETLMRTGDWVADVKMDGVRALAHWDGQNVRMTNRNDVNVNHRYPEVVDALRENLQGRGPLILDGEIVARDGKFESTLLRDKQESAFRIGQLMVSHPVMFVAFDLPSVPAEWEARRAELDLIADEWTDRAQWRATLSTTVTSFDPGFLDQVKALGMEGVIAKHIHSRYESGKRSPQWKKFKHLHRVTCIVANYHPGQGSRAHFGAMDLLMLDPVSGHPVNVGRVGTGFTEREIAGLKKVLDAGDVLLVEVEALGVTSGGQLRQPVYIDVRTDVDPHQCTTTQLDSIPRC